MQSQHRLKLVSVFRGAKLKYGLKESREISLWKLRASLFKKKSEQRLDYHCRWEKQRETGLVVLAIFGFSN